MRIKNIELELNEFNLGLAPITMHDLGSVVALVGKNGSGKSRFLKSLQSLSESKFINSKTKLNEIYEFTTEFDNRTDIIPSDTIKTYHDKYVKYIDIYELKNFKEGGDIYTNREKTGFNVFNNLVTSNTYQDLQALLQKFLADDKQNRYSQLNFVINSDNEDIKSETKRLYLGSDFYKFSMVVKEILGKELKFEILLDDSINILLGDHLFSLDLLSDGEKILFNIAKLLFHFSNGEISMLDKYIIIIDEPETHLHPDAQLLLIDKLKSIVKDHGQLWIATHSIHILSHLHQNEIFFVDNGRVVSPGRQIPQTALDSLVSTQQNAQELIDMFTSMFMWSANKFLIECFNNPNTIFSTDSNDNQFQLIKDKIETGDKVKILDYGAGQGRIGYMFRDASIHNVEYHSYEPICENEEQEIRLSQISTKFYKTTLEIPHSSFFDIVILCNTLHEITKELWVGNLASIMLSLKDDGKLIIVEDKHLRHGEKISGDGYLILRKKNLDILMRNTSETFVLKKDFERFVLATYTKSQITPSDKSVLESIKSLQSTVFEELNEIRDSQVLKDSNSGRIYANYCQLYINTVIALR